MYIYVLRVYYAYSYCDEVSDMAAENDSLTGLPGGGAIHTALGKAIQNAEGTSLAVLDIDYFVDVNADLGPEVGDHLLRAIAGLLADEAREVGGAAAFRISGDAFALILPGIALEQAFLRMERLRTRVEDASDLLPGVPGGRRVTVSIGVAQAPRDGRDAPGLQKAAEAALAAAKEQGRNAVALPPNEEMVMKSCYYPAASARQLRALAERTSRKESVLLREALTDLLRKYDTL